MRRVCAWCNKDLENNNDNYDENTPITHGICSDCVKLLEFQEIPMENFLEKLNKAIFLTDKDAIVEVVSEKAIVKLKKPKNFIKNFPLGNVSQCIYAELPEGCGKTSHCSGCDIRSAVLKTYSTGESVNNLETFQYQKGEKGLKKVRMAISTEKFGEKVLLQIDSIND